MNEYITINSNTLVGKPVIKGTRIPVSLILNLIAHGYSIKNILDDYPNLTKPAVIAAYNKRSSKIN